jgi:adenylate kinase
MVKKVIYLTGAPAAGKTTTIQKLLENRDDIELWAYSSRLMTYLEEAHSDRLTHETLRQKSGTVVRPEDIVAVDQKLIEFISRFRSTKYVIIDSHPITKEDYGFRCTAFSAEQIRTIAPDEIWVLYADPETTIERIRADGDAPNLKSCNLFINSLPNQQLIQGPSQPIDKERLANFYGMSKEPSCLAKASAT